MSILENFYHPVSGDRIISGTLVNEVSKPRLRVQPSGLFPSKYDSSVLWNIGEWVGAELGGAVGSLGYYSTEGDDSTFVEVIPLTGSAGSTQIGVEFDQRTTILRITARRNDVVVTHDMVGAFVDGRVDTVGTFPRSILSTEWDAQEDQRDATAPQGPQTVDGKRLFWGITSLQNEYVSTDFELRVYSGPSSAGVGDDSNTRAVDSDFWVSTTFPVDQQSVLGMVTNGTMSVGTTCYNVLYWKRLSDSTYQQASADIKSFTILGLTSTDPDPEPDPEPDPDPQTPTSAQDITHDGVTFGLSATTDVYYSASGDPMVKGPVTITSISPASSGDTNGAELNWALTEASHSVSNGRAYGPDEQGFDNSTWTKSQSIGYTASLNKDPGKTGSSLTVNEGTVIKSITKSSPADPPRPSVQKFVTLSVIPSADPTPAVGSFRPGSSGVDTSIRWTTADCASVSSLFPNLSTPAGMPDYNTMISRLERPWPAKFMWGDHGRRLMADDHFANDYAGDHRGHGMMFQDAVLMMMCDGLTSAEKVRMRNALVQMGIDIWDRLSFRSDAGVIEGGALGPYMKTPLVMAAMFLDDTDLKSMAAETVRFHEDRQIRYVTQADVDRGSTTVSGNATTAYQSGDIGQPEWGEQFTRQPQRASRALDGYKVWGTYRKGNGWVMGAGLIGALCPTFKTIWSNDAVFDYADRREYYHFNHSDSTNRPSTWCKNFWNAHRSTGTARTFGPGTSTTNWSN